jgi:hypothetical protein
LKLLDVVEISLPINDDNWKEVAKAYNQQALEENQRESADLYNLFVQLRNHPKPTGINI